MLNKVFLLGNLGEDPKLTEGNNPRLSLRLATTFTYKKGEQKQEKTSWHSVTIWGNRGVALARFLKKGSRVHIEGRIEYSEYEKDGQKRYRTDIVAEDIQLLGGSKKGPQENDDGDNGRIPDDDDLPF